MAIKIRKLYQLLEQHMNEGRGLPGYRGQLREMLGIAEGDAGDPVLNRAEQIIDPKNVSLQEVAATFLGRDFGASDVRRAFGLTEQLGRFQEAEGHVVLPSHFAKISAFSDTVSGLIDALTMEAYQSPEFIGDALMEVREARVNGGKMIGVMNDGGVGDDLNDGEPYPTVGLKETYVEVPDNQRRGNTIQVNEKVFVYDRTDLLESACAAAGTAVRRKKEIKQADCVLGITNTYSRDGNTSDTYLTADGDVPNDFTNSSTNQLDDYTDINNAIQVLEGNTDPGTGFEIAVPTEGAQVLVMPQKRMTATNILYPEWIRVATATATINTQAKSPLPKLELVVASRIWYNRLIAAGVSTTNAPERWHMGLFKKAFQYRQIIPFQVADAPLSSEDVRRDVVLIKVAREHGVPFVKEPRYSYQGTKE